MRDKFPIIKNRDRCNYRFNTHKWIDLAGADYLTDNNDISVKFFWTNVIAEGYYAQLICTKSSWHCCPPVIIKEYKSSRGLLAPTLLNLASCLSKVVLPPLRRTPETPQNPGDPPLHKMHKISPDKTGYPQPNNHNKLQQKKNMHRHPQTTEHWKNLQRPHCRCTAQLAWFVPCKSWPAQKCGRRKEVLAGNDYNEFLTNVPKIRENPFYSL